MLSDTARKLLMIMTHSANHHAHMPSLPELERLSGRMPVPIKTALLELVEENYIEWNSHMPMETAIIIEGWERPDPRFKKRHTAPQEIQWGMDGGNIEYWTMY
ncbi:MULTISPECIES: hypothetical protein [unclassified Paenibacillus]|uniref:hypothetical protein n=1 Tax=unclassified Paenibacillus TaxID=185978 RepID=UPI0024744931|nr:MULTISPECIES: hypothetical protein [unclassified Paenibacillus]MDH6430300.1 hypothetical protein [Paenibacillus sp. PastH-4]MDH6446515.1 hypothetical protein [Paenibacillus sp. PastF-4]MDH6530019.1 hypothetical protein [Paenibacillus sp. PastH-3]